jgi:hypothetical protein
MSFEETGAVMVIEEATGADPKPFLNLIIIQTTRKVRWVRQ